MEYEKLHSQLTTSVKSLEDVVKNLKKALTNIKKQSETGDFTKVSLNVDQAASLLRDGMNIIEQAQSSTKQFDVKEYFQNGDFGKELVTECKAKKMDVQIEAPNYIVFPLTLIVNNEDQTIVVNKKKLGTIRPKAIAEDIRKKRDKMFKAAFNAQAFADDLFMAYTVARAVDEKLAQVEEIYLTDLYNYMVPLARSRKEYDTQSFFFDVARLYTSGINTSKKGHSFTFGSSRNDKKTFRIRDNEGKEFTLATIKFSN